MLDGNNVTPSEKPNSPDQGELIDTRSYYVPGGFYIYLRPGILSECGALKPGGAPTFVHEYAHLVQDRMCVNGVYQTLLTFDGFAGVAELVRRKASGGALLLPLSRDASFEGSLLHSTMNLQMSFGHSHKWDTDVNWAYERFQLVERQINVQGKLETATQVVVTWVDNVNNDTRKQVLGAKEIKEAYSVAVAIIHNGNEVTSTKQFEYLAVERMLNKELHRVTPEQIVAICHWSLQSPAPAIRLIQIVQYLASTQGSEAKLQPASELFDTLRDHTISEWCHESTVDDVLRQLEELEQLQKANGESDPLFRAIKWYLGTTRDLLSRSTDGSRFPLETFLCDPTKDFEELKNVIPVSVVEHGDGPPVAFGGTVLDTDSALFMRAIGDLTHRLAEGKASTWACPMVHACSLSQKNDKCKVQPWRPTESTKQCAYRAAAAYLNLADVTIGHDDG